MERTTGTNSTTKVQLQTNTPNLWIHGTDNSRLPSRAKRDPSLQKCPVPDTRRRKDRKIPKVFQENIKVIHINKVSEQPGEKEKMSSL